MEEGLKLKARIEGEMQFSDKVEVRVQVRQKYFNMLRSIACKVKWQSQMV